MSQQALWSGRFDGEMDDSTLQFTSSLDVDKKLSFYDVMGSLAHVKMLKERSIIPAEDADSIIGGLRTIASEMKNGVFTIDYSLEDIHTNVEFRLTDIIGPAGGKLHTGRSRNDQVATDFKMYLRDAVLTTVGNLNTLIDSLLTIAKDNGSTIMPGFTHMQHAQPVTLAEYALAYLFKFSRDAQRFMDSFERMNYCPLGSAALAGTTYIIDRDMTAKALGFRGPTYNSMDSVSDRDFVTELAFCASLTSIHLSSMAEELVFWSTAEFRFVELDDRYTTGSSIMPQKKNPDIAELIRGKCGAVNGSLFTMLMLTKGLPLSYNRDLQEDKKPVMDALDTLNACVVMMNKMISTMKVNKDSMLKNVKSGFINATDLADYLVTKDIPFREAHGIVGSCVRYCIENKKNLDDLTLEEFRTFSPVIKDDVYDFIDIRNCVERRSSFGGTSSASTDQQIYIAMREYMSRVDSVRQEKEYLESCWNALLND
jgi:argininosuccinate lyase